VFINQKNDKPVVVRSLLAKQVLMKVLMQILIGYIDDIDQ
jgi:hypothetical protein